jgi:hypothetical protein
MVHGAEREALTSTYDMLFASMRENIQNKILTVAIAERPVLFRLNRLSESPFSESRRVPARNGRT